MFQILNLKKQISELTGCPEMPLGFSGGLKNLPANAGDEGSIPGWGRSPGEETATHSSNLAWKVPWTEKPHRLQSVG